MIKNSLNLSGTLSDSTERLGGYIVNSLDCYSYRIIGKLTAFLYLQEFSCTT
jgi:hypothetical protein